MRREQMPRCKACSRATGTSMSVCSIPARNPATTSATGLLTISLHRDGVRGFAVHAEKDREMARRADYGLMIWDGVSPGTFLNVLRLAIVASPCVIYDTMRGRVATDI